MVKIKKKEIDQLEMNAVRKCSNQCYFFSNGGKGCQYYQKKEVTFGETCMYDIAHVKGYTDSFQNGDLDFVKRDAAGITALLMLQIRKMLEQVSLEGVTVDEPILDAKGSPVWIPDPDHNPAPGEQRRMIVAMRKSDHPLIARCIQLARSVGVNLSEFKLTPKSAEEKRQVSGHIIAENPEDIRKVMDERKKIEEKFINAIAIGNRMTAEDPVYRKLLKDGEIVG